MALTQAEIDAIRDKIAKNAPFQQLTTGDQTAVFRDPKTALEALNSVSRKNRVRTRSLAPTKAL